MAQVTIELPVDEALLRRVERVAAEHQTTVADMLGSALQALGELDFDLNRLPPVTRSAVGIAKGLPDRPYKELLADALWAKYGPLE